MGRTGYRLALVLLVAGLAAVITATNLSDSATAGVVGECGLGAIAVAVLLAAGTALTRASRAARLRAALTRAGRPGRAEVLAVSDTGVSINDNPRVDLRVRVVPDDGGAPFDGHLRVTVSRLAVPRAGDHLPVRFDPADHSRIILVRR